VGYNAAMTDPRVERLAELVVDYSLGLGEGDVVRIDGTDVAAPFALALYRAALRSGAHPYTNVQISGLLELLLAHGSREQLEYISPLQWDEIERIDALVTVWSEVNTRALSRVDPGRHAGYIGAQRKLSNRRWERISNGEMRWCGTLFPTAAHAQDADMSLADYEDFVFGACHVDEDGSAEHWRGVSGALGARADELASARELRIVGPDTDLRVGVAGRTWLAADGRYNLPDGEVFTSPLETATEGEIRYTFPAIYHGREVEDVRLRFAGGRVVHAEAVHGDDYLRSLLEMDDGARVLGEVAFGLNYEIDRFTRNILFDEKIGGTMHLALGSGFPQAGGRNTSGLHWDMICDLREEGEVYADGELVWKAGRFLGEPATVRVESAVGG
jgi:aminopeptidase